MSRPLNIDFMWVELDADPCVWHTAFRYSQASLCGRTTHHHAVLYELPQGKLMEQHRMCDACLAMRRAAERAAQGS